jgi:hypothetical protein
VSCLGFGIFILRQRLAPSEEIVLSTHPAAQPKPIATLAPPTKAKTPPPPVQTQETVSFHELTQAFAETDKEAAAAIPPHSPSVSPSVLPSVPPQPTIATLDAETLSRIQQTLQILERLNQQMEYNLNQVKDLEGYTRDISQTITKLNTAISAMDNRILALTNTASSLSTDVGNVRKDVGSVKRALGDEGLDTPPKKTQKNTPELASADLYTVHAIIPGRAWLKTSQGKILTITEGEDLGNYGKVLVIDATNGVVLTNSGITFK